MVFQITDTVVALILLYRFVDFGTLTKLDNGVLEKGFYVRAFGFVKIKHQIGLNEIEEVEIVEDNEMYFEIIAFSKSDQMTLKRFANKNPAKTELSKIKAALKPHPLNYSQLS